MRQIQVINMTENIAGGQGSLMGNAYRLKSGQVVYLPKSPADPVTYPYEP